MSGLAMKANGGFEPFSVTVHAKPEPKPAGSNQD